MTTQPLGTPALEASSPSFGGPSASASVDESGPASDASDSASRHDFSAHRVSRSEAEEKNAADEDDDSGDEFEFTFAVRDADAFPAVARTISFPAAGSYPPTPSSTATSSSLFPPPTSRRSQKRIRPTRFRSDGS
ncbi:unnamed protein product [Musa textilis]